jgi:hypothetical protein
MFLAGFGSMVGPGPHMRVANVTQTARIWPVLVGDTAKARKGTSWDAVEPILLAADAGRKLHRLGLSLKSWRRTNSFKRRCSPPIT